MLKLLMIPASAALVVGHATHELGRTAEVVPAAVAPGTVQVQELLDAARGVNPLVCWYAADGVSGGFAGRLEGVPHPALGRDVARRARALVRDTLDGSARTRVREALRSADACEREIATRLIGRDRRDFDSAELNAMLRELFDEQLSPARISAAIVAGLTVARDVVDAVHDALADANVEVRANSAWALGRIRNPDSARPLSAALNDTEPSVRAASITALQRVGVDDAVLLRVLREDRSAEVRRAAAWALQRSRTPQAVEGLTRAMREDQDEDVREMAAWALAHTRSASAADALAEVVRTDRSRHVRATAAWGVGQIAPRRMPAPALSGLADDDREVRLRTAWAAGQVRDAEAIPALRRALDNEQDSRVRSALVRALIMAGERDPAAVESLLRSDDEEVRRHAVMMLAGRSRPWPWPWPQPRPYP